MPRKRLTDTAFDVDLRKFLKFRRRSFFQLTTLKRVLLFGGGGFCLGPPFRLLARYEKPPQLAASFISN